MLPLLPAEQRLQAVANASVRIAHGEFLDDIAADIGVSKQTLSLWLLDDLPEQYKLAQRRGLIRRIADADQRLEEAEDPLDLAKAREMAKFARWDAERRLPALFGMKQEISHTHTMVVEERLQADLSELVRSVKATHNKPQVLDITPIPDTPLQLSATDVQEQQE